MRKLKYYVAVSVDNYIAHEDGTWEGFLPEGEHIPDYLESLKTWFDVVLMGRKTYEAGLKMGVTNPYPYLKQYVFSRTMQESPDENVELVSENIVEFVKQLKKETGKDIYLCGGATLATMLFTENLIDEIILKLNPFLMGSGIPLFAGVIEQTQLELTDSKIYSNGVVFLFYRVKNEGV
jgi:dihydrofolate reductase